MFGGRGWRDDTAVESTGCSCRGPWFPALTQPLTTSCISSPKVPDALFWPPWALISHVHGAQADIHASKHTLKAKTNLFLKNVNGRYREKFLVNAFLSADSSERHPVVRFSFLGLGTWTCGLELQHLLTMRWHSCWKTFPNHSGTSRQ